MLLALTPTQLRALDSLPAAILADLLQDAAPGQDQELSSGTGSRRAYGKALQSLADCGLVAVADPGAWTRSAYTVRLLPAEDGHWCREVGALDHWPRLYPEIWDQLREERPDLDAATFRQRFRHGVIAALGAERPVSSSLILRWLGNALNTAAPEKLPDPKTIAAPPDQTPVPRPVLRSLMGDPEYVRLANFLPDGEQDGN